MPVPVRGFPRMLLLAEILKAWGEKDGGGCGERGVRGGWGDGARLARRNGLMLVGVVVRPDGSNRPSSDTEAEV